MAVAIIPAAAHASVGDGGDSDVGDGKQVLLAQADPAAPDAAPVDAPAPDAAPTDAPAPTTQETPALPQATPTMPTGTVAESGSGFPLSLTAILTQSVYAGTFAPGYAANPSYPTNLRLRPAYKLYKFVDWQPDVSFGATIDFDIEWASSYTGTAGMGPVDRQLRISDTSLSVAMPTLVKETLFEKWSLTFAPTVRAIVPTSIGSRYNNRLVGFGAGATLGTGFDFGSFGSVDASFVPTASGWTFTGDSPNQSCGSEVPGSSNTFFGDFSPTDGTTDVPAAVGRPEEYIDETGRCRVKGRQVIASTINTVSIGYTIKDPWGGTHNIATSGGTWHTFLRPLADRPELRSKNATPQSQFNIGAENTFADLGYSYTLPLETAVTFGLGLSSLSPMFDQVGNLRNPLFDLTPFIGETKGLGGNNLTAATFSLTIAL